MTRQPSNQDRADIMGGLIPPQIGASPADIPKAPDDAMRAGLLALLESNLPWWRPGPIDVARAIGWRWLLVIPLLAVAGALPFGMVFFRHFTGQLIHIEIKAAIFALAGAASIVIWGIKNVVKMRTDPFCVHCGYSLTGLPETGTCPECGHTYLGPVIAEYRKDPHFFIARYNALRTAPRHTPFVAGDGPTPDDGTR